MKVWPVLVLSLGLVATTILLSHAQLPLSGATVVVPCVSAAIASGTQQRQSIEATVTRVDPGHGQLEFITETGIFVLTTTAELHDLRVGDHLLLCLHADVSEDGARIAQEAPTATAQPSETFRPSAEPIREPPTETEPGKNRHE